MIYKTMGKFNVSMLLKKALSSWRQTLQMSDPVKAMVNEVSWGREKRGVGEAYFIYAR